MRNLIARGLICQTAIAPNDCATTGRKSVTFLAVNNPAITYNKIKTEGHHFLFAHDCVSFLYETNTTQASIKFMTAPSPCMKQAVMHHK